jgi:hypothetical protein
LFKEYGFTVQHVVDQALALVNDQESIREDGKSRH